MKWPVVIGVAAGAMAVALVLGWIGVRQEREFRRLIAAGDAAVSAGRTNDAIEVFSGAIALKPDSMLPYLKRGDTYRRRAEYAAALRDLRQASVLDLTAVRPIELLGDVYLATDRIDEARAAYARYLALDDRAAPVLYKLALAHYRGADCPAASDLLRRAVAIDTSLAEAHYLLGLCLREERRDADAIRAFTRAVTVDPTLAVARETLADIYLEAGRARESLQHLEALTELEPTRPERTVALGLAYARVGRVDAAVIALGRASERFPDSQLVLTALGRTWLQIADLRDDAAALRKARQLLQVAASGSESSSETLGLYGRALLLSDEVRLAERVLQQAASRMPVSAAALADLSDAASRLGHAAIANRARAQYEALTAN